MRRFRTLACLVLLAAAGLARAEGKPMKTYTKPTDSELKQRLSPSSTT